MSTPTDRKYTKDHEWALVLGDIATIGITDYAQTQLGNIVYVELPKVGAQVEQGKSLGVVESVKTVSPIYAPVSGGVTEINGALEDDPELVNREPYAGGWLVKVKVSGGASADGLLDASAYDAAVAAEQG